jgi:alpha-tubulin suppressor-like RCC1 family protein
MSGRTRILAVAVLLLVLPVTRAYAGSEPSVASGNGTSCALFPDQHMWCWGRNDVGQLADGTTTDRLRPIQEGFANRIAVADRNVCRLYLNSLPFYKCAGANEFGQIGDGTTIDRHSFTASVLGIAPFSFTAGDSPCAAVYLPTDGGTLVPQAYCWGSNQAGSVGDGTTTDRSSPVLVGLPGAQAVVTSGGGGHACAYVGPGSGGPFTLWCWGNNVDDSLGLGSGAGPMSPVPVEITLPNGGPRGGEGQLALGVHHNCMIATDGTLWCWGLNDHGQLGDGTTIPRSTPVQVMGVTNAIGVWVSPSGGFTCAASQGSGVGGDAYCWGRNDRGQLGDGTTTDRLVPAFVPGLDGHVTSVVPGQDHACAFSNTGIGENQFVRCWGANDHGQVGDGTTTERHSPVLLTFTTPPPTVPALGGVPIMAVVVILFLAGALSIGVGRARRR